MFNWPISSPTTLKVINTHSNVVMESVTLNLEKMKNLVLLTVKNFIVQFSLRVWDVPTKLSSNHLTSRLIPQNHTLWIVWDVKKSVTISLKQTQKKIIFVKNAPNTFLKRNVLKNAQKDTDQIMTMNSALKETPNQLLKSLNLDLELLPTLALPLTLALTPNLQVEMSYWKIKLLRTSTMFNRTK